MLKIKLVRIGKKNQPQYRIVVDEARSKNGGTVTDQLGHYNPLASADKLKLDLNKYHAWIAKGAQPTSTIFNLVKTLKPTKPKKSSK